MLDLSGHDDEDVVGIDVCAVDALAGGVACAPGDGGDPAQQRLRGITERGRGAQDVEVGVLLRLA